MDWFLYDNSLRHERVKALVTLTVTKEKEMEEDRAPSKRTSSQELLFSVPSLSI